MADILIKNKNGTAIAYNNVSKIGVPKQNAPNSLAVFSENQVSNIYWLEDFEVDIGTKTITGPTDKSPDELVQIVRNGQLLGARIEFSIPGGEETLWAMFVGYQKIDTSDYKSSVVFFMISNVMYLAYQKIGNELEWRIIEAESGGGLPHVTPSDAGKILKVNSSGEWDIGEENKELPAVDSEDVGKVLKVDSNGEWGAETESNFLVAETESNFLVREQ